MQAIPWKAFLMRLNDLSMAELDMTLSVSLDTESMASGVMPARGKEMAFLELPSTAL